MKRLTYYFKGYIKETIFGPLFKLLEASFELLVPIVIAKMIDETIPRGDRSSLLLQIGLTRPFHEGIEVVYCCKLD